MGHESKKKLRAVLGKNVRTNRERLGISQEELGERAGLSQVYVSQVETAKTAASVDTIEKLAIGLRVPPNDLLRT